MSPRLHPDDLRLLLAASLLDRADVARIVRARRADAAEARRVVVTALKVADVLIDIAQNATTEPDDEPREDA